MLDVRGEIRIRALYFDGQDIPCRGPLFGAAVSEVAIPVRIAQRVLHQLGLVGFGGSISTFSKYIHFQIVVCCEAFHFRHDDDIRELACLDLVGFNSDRESALQDAQNRIEVPLADRLQREADGDHDVGFHRVDLRRGQVLEDGAVDILVTAQLEGAEDARDGGGCADGIGQRSASEGDRFGRSEVGSLAAERDGQIVEVRLVVIAEELFVEQLVQPVVGQQAVAKRYTMLEADSNAIREITAFFAAPVAQSAVVGADAEDTVHLVAGEDVPHLLRCVARGVQRGKNGAHRGTSDDIDRDMVLFHPLDRPDLAHGDGCPAAQGKPNDGTGFGQVGRCDRYICRGQAQLGGRGRVLCGTGGLGFRRCVLAALLLSARSILGAHGTRQTGTLLRLIPLTLGSPLALDDRGSRISGCLAVRGKVREARQASSKQQCGGRDREKVFRQLFTSILRRVAWPGEWWFSVLDAKRTRPDGWKTRPELSGDYDFLGRSADPSSRQSLERRNARGSPRAICHAWTRPANGIAIEIIRKQ